MKRTQGMVVLHRVYEGDRMEDPQTVTEIAVRAVLIEQAAPLPDSPLFGVARSCIKFRDDGFWVTETVAEIVGAVNALARTGG